MPWTQLLLLLRRISATGDRLTSARSNLEFGKMLRQRQQLQRKNRHFASVNICARKIGLDVSFQCLFTTCQFLRLRFFSSSSSSTHSLMPRSTTTYRVVRIIELHAALTFSHVNLAWCASYSLQSPPRDPRVSILGLPSSTPRISYDLIPDQNRRRKSDWTFRKTSPVVSPAHTKQFPSNKKVPSPNSRPPSSPWFLRPRLGNV